MSSAHGEGRTGMDGFERIGDELGANVSVIVVDAAPGDGPRLHRHPYREVFVVLEGEATCTLGDEKRVVHGGEIVVAPAWRPAPVRRLRKRTPPPGGCPRTSALRHEWLE